MSAASQARDRFQDRYDQFLAMACINFVLDTYKCGNGRSFSSSVLFYLNSRLSKISVVQYFYREGFRCIRLRMKFSSRNRRCETYGNLTKQETFDSKLFNIVMCKSDNDFRNKNIRDLKTRLSMKIIGWYVESLLEPML